MIATQANGIHSTSTHSNETPHAPSVEATQSTALLPAVNGDLTYSERAVVIQGHLRLMEQFLRSQEAVMRLFLSGDAPEIAEPQWVPAISVPQRAAVPVAPVVEQGHSGGNGNGYHHHAPVNPMPPVTAAPTPAVTAPPAPAAPPTPSPAPTPAPAADTQTAHDPARLKSVLLGLVSSKTGYPEEMLDLNANLEADLGIDSIKRVEILGAFNRETQLLDPADIEQVSSLKTLGAMLDFFQKSLLTA